MVAAGGRANKVGIPLGHQFDDAQLLSGGSVRITGRDRLQDERDVPVVRRQLLHDAHQAGSHVERAPLLAGADGLELARLLVKVETGIHRLDRQRGGQFLQEGPHRPLVQRGVQPPILRPHDQHRGQSIGWEHPWPGVALAGVRQDERERTSQQRLGLCLRRPGVGDSRRDLADDQFHPGRGQSGHGRLERRQRRLDVQVSPGLPRGDDRSDTIE